jgi:hypothetical protein
MPRGMEGGHGVLVLVSSPCGGTSSCSRVHPVVVVGGGGVSSFLGRDLSKCCWRFRLLGGGDGVESRQLCHSGERLSVREASAVDNASPESVAVEKKLWET